MSTESRTFVAREEQLAEILNWIFFHIERSSLPDREQKRTQLALEEAIVNVVRHGRSNAPIELTISVRHESKEQIEFELADNGNALNPLSQPVVDQSDRPLDQRVAGGLGLLLIKQCMDSVTYQHKGGCNILTLTKNL